MSGTDFQRQTSVLKFQVFISADTNLHKLSKVLYDITEIINMVNLINKDNFVQNRLYLVSNAYFASKEYTLQIYVVPAISFQNFLYRHLKLL